MSCRACGPFAGLLPAFSSDVWFAAVFSGSVGYRFTFSVASFEAQTFLILTRSSRSVSLLLVPQYRVRESIERWRSTKIHPRIFLQGVLEFQLLHVDPRPFLSSSCLVCEEGSHSILSQVDVQRFWPHLLRRRRFPCRACAFLYVKPLRICIN